MKILAKRIYHFVNLLGFDLRRFLNFFRGFPLFVHDYFSFYSQKNTSSSDFDKTILFPCLSDRFEESGSAKGHYFHQDLLVANRVFENNPNRHVDIGSRIDGFVAHVASYRSIDVFDIRKLEVAHKNINFVQCDLMKALDSSLVAYCDSLSCLHALEHFGLGRYGDPINFDGHLIGLRNMTKVLSKNGTFYFSVPIGQQRIEYNAHRVFSVSYLLKILSEDFTVKQFSYVDDNGELHKNVELTKAKIESSFNCHYGCGIFELIKN